MKLGLNKMSKKRQKTTNKKTAQNTQKKSDTKPEVKSTDSKMKSVKRQPKRIREARFDKPQIKQCLPDRGNTDRGDPAGEIAAGARHGASVF